MFGDKVEHQQTQDQVPHQGRVAPALEVAKAQFRLTHAELMFHVPAAKGDTQQPLQRGDGTFFALGAPLLVLISL